jgi:hypothetical protein
MKLFFLEKPSDGWFWHPMANRVAPKTRLTVPRILGVGREDISGLSLIDCNVSLEQDPQITLGLN